MKSVYATSYRLKIVEAQMFRAEGRDSNDLKAAFIPSKTNPFFGAYLRTQAHLQRLLFLQNSLGVQS